MPLLYIDLVEGRTPAEVQPLLDALHAAVVEAFGVPESDRYQVVRTHPADLIVSITENSDEDWSFGHGRAQFLTGELEAA